MQFYSRFLNTNPKSFDYISDNITHGKTNYSPNEIAQIFSQITQTQHSPQDIYNLFGKEVITDQDLYQMIDIYNNQDGYISADEIKNFVEKPSANEEAGEFSYLADNKTSYSLDEVIEKIKNMTGKTISKETLQQLMAGQETMSDFELMLLLDTTRNGKISSDEINDLISDFNITYTIANNPSTPKTSDYQKDTKTSYTKEEFKAKMKTDLELDLSDAQISKLFSDNTITDAVLKDLLDKNKDGNLTKEEISEKLNLKAFDYLEDDKTKYTKEELKEKLNNLRETPITDSEFNDLFGTKEVITDKDLLVVIDQYSPNGSITTSDLSNAVKPASDEGFNYLKDEKISYSAQELALYIAQITGTNITEKDIKTFFGKDTITDYDILALDTQNINGIIDKQEASVIL